MAERNRADGRDEPRLDEMVLTRVGDNAVIRPLDGVTMDEVKRYVQAERSRNRRTVVWTGTLLLGVFLFFLVIFLSIGIYVTRMRAGTGTALSGLKSKNALQASVIGELSNRIAVLENVQVDLGRLLDEVEKAEVNRTRELDGVLADLAKVRSWVGELDAAREASLAKIDDQVRAARDATSQQVADVRTEIERMISERPAPPPRSDMPDIGQALQGLPDLLGATGLEPQPMPADAVALETIELSERALDAAAVFAVEEVASFDPGQAQREIQVVDFPNGDHYEGELENGLMHGWGVFMFRNGDRYDGQFVEGLREGRGTLVYANGDKYVGDFKADVRAGRGSLSMQIGDRYVGEFANDLPNGRGTLLQANGNKYVGNLVNGKRQGAGILRFANGDIYRGEFTQDARTGRGTYVFADGSQYTGDFVDGRRQGQGRYRYAGGEEYEGQFQDGVRQGAGVSIFPNGRRVKGLWESDRVVRYLTD